MRRHAAQATAVQVMAVPRACGDALLAVIPTDDVNGALAPLTAKLKSTAASEVSGGIAGAPHSNRHLQVSAFVGDQSKVFDVDHEVTAFQRTPSCWYALDRCGATPPIGVAVRPMVVPGACGAGFDGVSSPRSPSSKWSAQVPVVAAALAATSPGRHRQR